MGCPDSGRLQTPNLPNARQSITTRRGEKLKFDKMKDKVSEIDEEEMAGPVFASSSLAMSLLIFPVPENIQGHCAPRRPSTDSLCKPTGC